LLPVEGPPTRPAPGAWQALLEHEPAVLRWPVPARGSFWKHDAPGRALRLSCEDVGLLGLGETSAPSYRLEVCIQQTPWVGNVGLFFGHRAIRLQGRPGLAYQVLEVAPVPGGQFAVRWRAVFTLGPRGAENSDHLAITPAFARPRGEHRLALTVGRGGLRAVSFDGKALPELNAAGLATPPDPDAYRGAFGLYANHSHGAFHHARFLFQEND
jgi:hypothetical protein